MRCLLPTNQRMPPLQIKSEAEFQHTAESRAESADSKASSSSEESKQKAAADDQERD